MRAGVARSAFESENVQNTSALGHFSKFQCRKIARSCGEKRVSKKNYWRRRSTFWSSDVKKIARRCGEKHLCKLKCTKYCVLAHPLKFRCRKNPSSSKTLYLRKPTLNKEKPFKKTLYLKGFSLNKGFFFKNLPYLKGFPLNLEGFFLNKGFFLK